MAFFLGVVAATLLAIVLAALAAFWYFKFWLRRKLGAIRKSVELVDPQFARPARLQLEIARDTAPAEAFEALWIECHALGFRKLADWNDGNGAFTLLRAARHETRPIALVLTENDEEHAAFSMFATTADNRLIAASVGPGPGLVTPTMSWEIDAALTPAAALLRLEAATREQAMREPELRLVEAVYERAWAARRDAELARAPDRAAVERRAQGRDLTEAQIEHAHAMELGHWHEQLASAVLDRWRRASRIDAVAWERLRDDVHVVHDRLRTEDISRLFRDDTAATLVAQFEAQGLSGIALYEKVVERVGRAEQRQRLGEVDRPLRAVVYGRTEPDPAELEAPARAHTYAAVDADGREVHGAVYASGSGDARRQLDALGLDNARILSDPLGGVSDKLDELSVDPELAAVAARAARESLGVALLRTTWGNKWVWAPPAALLAWSLYEGPPWSGGDWFVFVYAVLAALVLLVFVAPMFLYNQLLAARMHARWSAAGLCLSLLSAFNVLGGISRVQLLAERCKILAGRGRLDDALALWKTVEATAPADEYTGGLISLYDCVGDHDRMIEAQQRFLQQTSAREMATVDLAMSLARHRDALDEAETLLAGVSPQNLSELALGAYHFVRGLVCAGRAQTGLALRQYNEALERIEQFRGNPLVTAMATLVHGYVAIALKQSGRTDEAHEIWRSVRDLLALHPSSRRVVELYERP